MTSQLGQVVEVQTCPVADPRRTHLRCTTGRSRCRARSTRPSAARRGRRRAPEQAGRARPARCPPARTCRLRITLRKTPAFLIPICPGLSAQQAYPAQSATSAHSPSAPFVCRSPIAGVQEAAGAPVTRNSRSPAAGEASTARRATLIWLVVIVPVLSLQMTVVQPSVSTLGNLRMHACARTCLSTHAGPSDCHSPRMPRSTMLGALRLPFTLPLCFVPQLTHPAYEWLTP